MHDHSVTVYTGKRRVLAEGTEGPRDCGQVERRPRGPLQDGRARLEGHTAAVSVGVSLSLVPCSRTRGLLAPQGGSPAADSPPPSCTAPVHQTTVQMPPPPRFCPTHPCWPPAPGCRAYTIQHSSAQVTMWWPWVPNEAGRSWKAGNSPRCLVPGSALTFRQH